jgi:hypothetical protein
MLSPDSVLNYADYIKGATSSCTTKFGASAVSKACRVESRASVVLLTLQCYNSHNNTAALQKDDTDKSWRLWTWQSECFIRV